MRDRLYRAIALMGLSELSWISGICAGDGDSFNAWYAASMAFLFGALVWREWNNAELASRQPKGE